MIVVQGQNNVDAMLKMYKAVINSYEMEARGSKCRNVNNLCILLEAKDPVITSFKARKFNLEYAKREWLWYLGADPKDDSIEQYASMWKKLKQEDGSFYSNYGQYIFAKDGDRPSQFEYCLKMLKDDPQTRRASMVLLKKEHLFPENTDTVCTYAINFFVEHGHLNMTVMMRSNDVVFGFTNDAFCFWNLYELMFKLLQAKVPTLKYGYYTHLANSMHVYDRHYDMLKAIVTDPSGNGGYTRIDVPRPSAQDAAAIVKSFGKDLSSEYGKWLSSSAQDVQTGA